MRTPVLASRMPRMETGARLCGRSTVARVSEKKTDGLCTVQKTRLLKSKQRKEVVSNEEEKNSTDQIGEWEIEERARGWSL